MTLQTTTTKTKTAPALIVGLLVLAGFMAAGPAMGDDHLDPQPPTDPDSGRFQLNIDNFTAQGNWGSWTTDSVEQTAGQTSGVLRPSFFITDDDIRDVVFRVNLETPSTTNGLIGFAIHHKDPSGASDDYDTYIVDWLAENRTIGGRSATEGLTLYHVDGVVANTNAHQLDCFWAKDCPEVTVLDTSYVTETETTWGRGWEPDSEYEFRIRFVGNNFPSQSGIKVDVRGGPADGYYDTPLPTTFKDVLEQGALPMEPAGFGFYSFRQGGAVWSDPTFIDDVRPELGVETDCLDPYPDPVVPLRTWCGGAVEVNITDALDHGSGLENITCTVNGDDLDTCYNAPFDVFVVNEHDARLRVDARDHAGNNKAYRENLRIDLQDPVTSVSALCRSDVVAGWCPDDVDLNGQSDALSPIKELSCELNGSPIACETTVDEDGTYVFSANATSAVERSDSDSVSFQRDATAPEGALVEPIPGCVYDGGEPSVCPGESVILGSVNVSVLADDPEVNNVSSGYSRTEFWDSGEMIGSIAAPGDAGWYNITWTPEPGDRTLEARLIDEAGNEEVLEYQAYVLPINGTGGLPPIPNPPSPEPPETPDPENLTLPVQGISANITGSANNNGDNAGNLSTSGGGTISVSVTPEDGANVTTSDPDQMVAGIEAYVGFLTGGFNGTAALWGDVAVDDTSCSFSTYGGDVMLPLYGSIPVASCEPGV